MAVEKNLYEFRKNYQGKSLEVENIDPDPFRQFSDWLGIAIDSGLPEPNAMVLSTASITQGVSSRTVLLKELDSKGFVFFTNYNSRKAQEIESNPYGSLLFLWLELERQVRIGGKIEKVSEKESDRYFNTRPRESQLGAWSSDQSAVIPDKKTLTDNFRKMEEQFKGKPIPRPDFWGGYRLTPIKMEFWQGQPGRMHDRLLYILTGKTWEIKRLSP
ncbi:MAG: pyridoxamine 5'-phosphate oxidase [Bacteroidales bacterium]